MKIKFDTFDKVSQFVRETMAVASDVFVKSGRFVIDGKSIMGIYSLDLSKDLELEVIEKIEGEEERLIARLKALNIVTE